jgi:hypothetical protein
LLSRIEITPDLVNQIIPHDFPDIEQEDNQKEDKNAKADQEQL